MHRETATSAQDLPHRYERESGGETCSTCQAQEGDQRHTEYERIESASRETAADQKSSSIRELGT